MEGEARPDGPLTIFVVLATNRSEIDSSVLTRRDLKHSRGGLGLNWPMCQNRHLSVSVRVYPSGDPGPMGPGVLGLAIRRAFICEVPGPLVPGPKGS